MGPKLNKGKNIQTAIQLELSRLGALVVNRTVGTFYTRFGTPIRIGQPGEADLQGIFPGQLCPHCRQPVHPAPFAIEVKGKGDRIRPAQANWRDNVWKRRGGLYTVARSVEDALQAFEGYIR